VLCWRRRRGSCVVWWRRGEVWRRHGAVPTYRAVLLRVVRPGSSVERVVLSPVQVVGPVTVVVGGNPVTLLLIPVVPLPPVLELGSFRPHLLLRGARPLHLDQDLLLPSRPLLLVVAVLQELGRRLLVVRPGRVADLHLHELVQEHVGGELGLGGVEHLHARGHLLLLDVLPRVKPDAVERLCDRPDDIEDLSQGSLARLQEEDRVQVQCGVPWEGLYHHQLLHAAGDHTDLDTLVLRHGVGQILNRRQVRQSHLVLRPRTFVVVCSRLFLFNNGVGHGLVVR